MNRSGRAGNRTDFFVDRDTLLWPPLKGELLMGGVVLRKSVNGTVTIDVNDIDPGIPPAEREKVFERFYRLDKARSRAEGGAGLGLAIARRAVEANGGTIQFVDGDQSGSCCRITLPGPDGRS